MKRGDFVNKRFGYELEFFGANLNRLAEKYGLSFYEKYTKVPYTFYHVKDEPDITKKIHNSYFGGELVSPILNDYQKGLKELRFLLKVLKKEGAYLEKNSKYTGFHIHLDRSFLTNWEDIQKLLKFLYAFQPEIYDVAKGEHEKIRDSIFLDIKPLTAFKVTGCLQTRNLEILRRKGNCICLNGTTLELRYFNSSLDLDILDSYFLFAFYLRDYIQNQQSDLELLEYYYQKALKNEDNFSLSHKRKKMMKKILTKM